MKRLSSILFTIFLTTTALIGCGRETFEGKIIGWASGGDNTGCKSRQSLYVETKDGGKIRICSNSPEHPGTLSSRKKEYEFITKPTKTPEGSKFVSLWPQDDKSPKIPVYKLIKMRELFDYPNIVFGQGTAYKHTGLTPICGKKVKYLIKPNYINKRLIACANRELFGDKGGYPGEARFILKKTSQKDYTGRPVYSVKKLKALEK